MALWLVLGYGVLSAAAFGTYGWDKRQARRGGRRIDETRLHALALAGGFPGAWVGMRFFRHKTKKLAFTAVIVLAAALHAALWAWVLARS